MAQLKKSEVDALVRDAGTIRIDTDGLCQIGSSTWIGATTVDGYERYYEVKVVAKKLGFSQEDIDVILAERAAVEARKAEVKAAAAKKAEKDKARRSKAKEEKEQKSE